MPNINSGEAAIRTAAQDTQIAMRQDGRARIPIEIASVDSVKQDVNGNWEAIVSADGRIYKAVISRKDGTIGHGKKCDKSWH
jgi:hypothetical protein